MFVASIVSLTFDIHTYKYVVDLLFFFFFRSHSIIY